MNKKYTLYLLTPLIMISLFAAIILPNIGQTKAATASFNVSMTISNSAPTITVVQAVADSPAEGTTKIVAFYFNASDANGAVDIPADNAQVIINKSGVNHTSTSCIITSTAGTTNAYRCNITIDYWDAAGGWTINASIYDGANARDDDVSAIFTMGTTYAISLNRTSLTFSGSPGDNNIAPSNAPQTVLNKGNGAFTGMQIKAFDLSNGAHIIGAAQFSANITDTATGHALTNNTDVTINGGTLAVQGERNVYIYLDVPNGISNGTYTATSEWIVTMS